ncbi:GATA transcription factor 20-like [Wolffia australiana]
MLVLMRHSFLLSKRLKREIERSSHSERKMQQCNSENRSCFQGVGGSGPLSIFFAIGGDESGNSPPPLAVDCTLSLGTPSTRQISNHVGPPNYSMHLDLLSSPSRPSSASSARVAADRLHLPRRCANCDTTSTPLWRNGPRGPKSLCNACGIRYKKEERRAASSAVASLAPSSPSTLPSLPRVQQQFLAANYEPRPALSYLPWRPFNVGATAHFHD